MAHSRDDLQLLKEEFQRLDADGDGTLSPQEIKGITDSKWCADNFKTVSWDRLLQTCDNDGDGRIDFQEFLGAAIKKRVSANQKDVKTVFKILDQNDDGTISLDEVDDLFKSLGGTKNKETLWEKLLEEADVNGDGVVTFQEFQDAMVGLLVAELGL